MYKLNTDFMAFARKHRKRETQVSLRLTSMIDMFTILLVFLLKNFSAEGQVITMAPDLNLPESTAQQAPEGSSIVAVTSDWILLDGKQVAAVAEVMSSSQLLIPGLSNELKKLRMISESVGELSYEMGFKGKISIQGDKEIPYQLLKKVMYTCGQMGYNDILLAVTKID